MYSKRTVLTALGSLLGLSTSVFFMAYAQADDLQHPAIVAHRGASAFAPENTLAAVDKAKGIGITLVENDVQRTKDGELVVMHDPTLQRTTNVQQIFPDRAPWRVSDFTLEEIKQLDAGSWFSSTFVDERVPTLEEYLDKVEANQQSLILEIKKPELYPGIEQQVLTKLGEKGWLSPDHLESRLSIVSFSVDTVKTVHNLEPRVKTGFIGKPTDAKLIRYAKFVDQIIPKYTQVKESYVETVHALEGAHGKPLELYTWTVNDGPTAVELEDMGVDGIVSDDPDLVSKAVQEGAGPTGSEGDEGSEGDSSSLDQG